MHNCYEKIRSFTLYSYPCDHLETRSSNVFVPLTSIDMFTLSITILIACENYCLIRSRSITCASLSVLTMSRLVNTMTRDSLSTIHLHVIRISHHELFHDFLYTVFYTKDFIDQFKKYIQTNVKHKHWKIKKALINNWYVRVSRSKVIDFPTSWSALYELIN